MLPVEPEAKPTQQDLIRQAVVSLAERMAVISQNKSKSPQRKSPRPADTRTKATAPVDPPKKPRLRSTSPAPAILPSFRVSFGDDMQAEETPARVTRSGADKEPAKRGQSRRGSRRGRSVTPTKTPRKSPAKKRQLPVRQASNTQSRSPPAPRKKTLEEVPPTGNKKTRQTRIGDMLGRGRCVQISDDSEVVLAAH